MKKIWLLLLVCGAIISLCSCKGEEDFTPNSYKEQEENLTEASYNEQEEENFFGTWKVETIDYEGSKFTVNEWKFLEKADYSGVGVILKEGGKAYIYDNNSGDLVDWMVSGDKMMLGERICSIVDKKICIGDNDEKLYLTKVSDSQEIPIFEYDYEEDSDKEETVETEAVEGDVSAESAVVDSDKEETVETEAVEGDVIAESAVVDSDKEETVETEAVEGDIFAERAVVDDGLGEYDFGGRQFRIVGHRTDEYYIEEDNRNKGDLIADAKFARNETVEERFNCEIVNVYKDVYYNVTDWVTKTILSGTDKFDLFCSHTLSAGGVVLKNVFLNWYDIPNVDFSKPWWSSSCATELTYDGKCILAVSDFNYTAIVGSYAMFFNKALANSYDMGNLYEVVLEGNWTFDYFYNLVKDIYVDTNGDGERSDGDFYGYAQDSAYSCADSSWLWAFDNPTVKKDADGVPQLAVKTDKINNIVTTLYDFFFNTTGVHYRKDNEANQGFDLFIAKRAVFAMGSISSPTSERLRNFEDDYGMLPLPKWGENQTNYYTMASGEHTCLAVPKTVKDTEFVGTVIEALSAESYKQVVPTLYEIALKTRYLRDDESKEVLDILIDGRVYEFGYIYDNYNGFGFTIGSMMGQCSSNFESYYSKKERVAKIHYKKIVKVFDKLD